MSSSNCLINKQTPSFLSQKGFITTSSSNDSSKSSFEKDFRIVDTGKRTELESLSMTLVNGIKVLVLLTIVMGAEFLYKPAALKYTLSDEGTLKAQASMPKIVMAFL
jgi:hypothetical protein